MKSHFDLVFAFWIVALQKDKRDLREGEMKGHGTVACQFHFIFLIKVVSFLLQNLTSLQHNVLNNKGI